MASQQQDATRFVFLILDLVCRVGKLCWHNFEHNIIGVYRHLRINLCFNWHNFENFRAHNCK